MLDVKLLNSKKRKVCCSDGNVSAITLIHFAKILLLQAYLSLCSGYRCLPEHTLKRLIFYSM
jgi:hypothetical protein